MIMQPAVVYMCVNFVQYAALVRRRIDFDRLEPGPERDLGPTVRR
jgi:hypothetical protein